jgi:hypothetical protein
MRKNALILALVCLSIFVSCKKKYKCRCIQTNITKVNSWAITDYSQNTTYYTYSAKAKDRDKTNQACMNDHNVPVTYQGYNSSQTECNLE